MKTKIILFLAALLMTGCSLMHDDRAGCERIVPHISSYTDGETFGMFILNSDNVVTEANVLVTVAADGPQTERELYHRDGNTYFLYSPYLPDTEGMPEKGSVMETRSPYEFFSFLATQGTALSRVPLGEFKSWGPCVIYFQMVRYEK